MIMENLDIKDFQSRSSVEKLDSILMVLSTGIGAKITVDLLLKILLKDIQPSINKDGEWLIGGVTTGISAEGKVPELRTSENGIEWKYEGEVSWRPLVGYDLLKLKFSDLTPEQINELKLKLSDLTAEEIESLRGGQGIPGVTGKSSYQLAQENGYKGTEEQFGTEQAAIVNNSQRLTTVEQNKQEKPIAGRSFLTPLFVARGAVFNDQTGYYELNGLTDITEDQMINIYNYTSQTPSNDNWTYMFWTTNKIRTNFSPKSVMDVVNMNSSFSQTNLEVIIVVNENHVSSNRMVRVLRFNGAFDLAFKVRKVIGIINLIDITLPFKFRCIELQDIKLFNLKVDINLDQSSKLTTDSIMYMVNNSTNRTVITLTLHPTAKARLTPEEIALASSKNITIA